MSETRTITVPEPNMTVEQLTAEYNIVDSSFFDDLMMYSSTVLIEGQEFEIPVEHFESNVLPEIKVVIVVAPPPEIQSAITSQQQLYQHMWEDAGNSFETYDVEMVEAAIVNAGAQWLDERAIRDIRSIDFFTEIDSNITSSQITDPFLLEVMALMDEELDSEQTNVDRLRQLIELRGVDALSQAYFEYYSVFSEYAPSGTDFHQFMTLYEHLRRTEEGLYSPFAPEFDPNLARDTYLYAQTLNPTLQNKTEEELQQYLVRHLAGNLDFFFVPDDEPQIAAAWSSGDIENILYQELEAQYGANYTTGEVAQLVNDITYKILTDDNLAKLINEMNFDGFSDVSTLSDYDRERLEKNFNESKAVLQGQKVDKARQIVHEWDYENAGVYLSQLEAKVQKIDNLPNEIFGVSLKEVKTAFKDTLKEFQAQNERMLWFRNDAFSQDQELYDINQETDEQIAQEDEILWTAFAIIAGTLAEPLDWGIGLVESLDEGNPSPFLAALLPTTIASIGGRVFRHADDVLGFGHYDDIWGYGDDAWTQVANDLNFMQGYNRTYDHWAGVFEPWSYAYGKSPLEYENGVSFTSKLWHDFGDNIIPKYVNKHDFNAWSKGDPMAGINNFEQFMLQNVTGEWIDIDPRYMTPDTIKLFQRSEDGKQILIPAEIGAVYETDGTYIFGRLGRYKVDEHDEYWDEFLSVEIAPSHIEGKIFTHYHPETPTGEVVFSHQDIAMSILGAPAEMRAVEYNGTVFSFKPTPDTQKLLGKAGSQREDWVIAFHNEFDHQYNNRLDLEVGTNKIESISFALTSGETVTLEFEYIVTNINKSKE